MEKEENCFLNVFPCTKQEILNHFVEHKHLISEECAMGAGHVGTESVLYLRVVMLSRWYDR